MDNAQIVEDFRKIVEAIPAGDVLASVSLQGAAKLVTTSGPIDAPPYVLKAVPGIREWGIDTYGPVDASAISRPGVSPTIVKTLARKNWKAYCLNDGGFELALLGFESV